MSIPYVEHGRVNQKLRTRTALVGAARALIDEGHTPSVEDAAAAASISRTTAYRYFPNQRDLLVAAYPDIDRTTLLPESPPDDVGTRLELVVDELLRTTVDNEPALRTALRLSLESRPEDRERLVVRRGRAIAWLSDALSPLRDAMPKKEFDRLVYAIRSAAGIESLVWLCDIAGLTRKQASDIMRWSARALVQAALTESGSK